MDDNSQAKKENLYARNKIKAMYKYIDISITFVKNASDITP